MAWSEVAGSYSLAFGQKNPAPRSGHPKRSLWDKVDGDLEHSFSKVGFNISAGHPDQKSVIFQDLKLVNTRLLGLQDILKTHI